VKLPLLWVNNVPGWFALAESFFAQFHIMDSLSRFNLVLPALDCETREHMRAVTHRRDTLPDPYLALKERLHQLYKLDIWEGLTKLLNMQHLGDVKPSLFLERMLVLLLPGLRSLACYSKLFFSPDYQPI